MCIRDRNYDALKNFINNYLEMPNRLISLLIHSMIQENGKISRAKLKELQALTDEEIATLEAKYAEIFLQ